MKEETIIEDGKVITKTTYDNTEVLKANERDRTEFSRYGNKALSHIGRIDMGDVVRLKNEGYNLLSPDPEEVKRALLYIQTNEPYLLTVPGKPISKKKQRWQ